jgi:predicted enzyme involved in methoxymalonyl-ACP biosynthesis
LKEKFVSSGNVMLAIVKLEENTVMADTFLMNYHVMERNIEKDFLGEIEK